MQRAKECHENWRCKIVERGVKSSKKKLGNEQDGTEINKKRKEQFQKGAREENKEETIRGYT